ncbi:Suppressor of cytokine signaling 6 [Armadillidium vulgare]|nr:Suppressor of cytokine signaling 6 [Armadillidium vulgare]
MFKDRRNSSGSTQKNNVNSGEEEPKGSPNTKKYKKKNLFTIILKEHLVRKEKSLQPYRSKSFEALSYSIDETEAHERVSGSEDSVYDRNKRGSRRSQSLRSKQAVCPAELGASQNATESSRTELQSNNEINLSSNHLGDTEDHSVISSHVEGVPDNPVEKKLLKPEVKTEKDIACNGVNPGKGTQNKKFLPSTSLQGKEMKTLSLKDLGVVRSPCLTINDGESKSLAKEIRELSKYGWYWGPLNRSEAEEKLADQLDGAFLVRDSSDVKYLLSLSFRSYGKTLHTRIEHSNGWFSFYPQPDDDHDSYRSVVDLINHCISESDGGVFCYSRPLIKGSPSFPVRLTKPLSRFMQVRSLQYLCRFVIRQYTSINHIQNLPLPPKIQGYLQESYY